MAHTSLQEGSPMKHPTISPISPCSNPLLPLKCVFLKCTIQELRSIGSIKVESKKETEKSKEKEEKIKTKHIKKKEKTVRNIHDDNSSTSPLTNEVEQIQEQIGEKIQQMCSLLNQME